MDTVILKDLKFDLAVGWDAWRRPAKLQPVILTLAVVPKANLEAAAMRDEVSLTLDYGKLYKKISAVLDQNPVYATAQGLLYIISALVPAYTILDATLHLPKAILEAKDGLSYFLNVDKSASETAVPSLVMAIKQVTCSCIIGVNPHERLYKQSILLDITVPVMVPAWDETIHLEQGTDNLHDMVAKIEDVSGINPC
jgi:dihydroneopterin aldolase